MAFFETLWRHIMSLLFEETKIHGITLRNRFVRSSTWESMATEEGECTKELVEFTMALARGGIGLVVMGHAYVQQNGKGTPRQSGIYCDDMIESFKPIPQECHKFGAKVAIQLNHAGGNVPKECNPFRI